MDINFEFYKVFYYVATEKQISAAAKRLYISQPAVSQSIRTLEKKLGGSLFYRTPRGMQLTKEGAILFEYVEQAFSILKTGEKKFNQIQSLSWGDLFIGASDTLCSHFLMKYLSQFNKSYPDVNLKVTNSTSLETIDLVKKGQVELGLVNLPLDTPKQIRQIPLKEIHDCFIYSDRFQRQVFGDKRPPNSMRGLTDFPLIALEKQTNTRQVMDKYFWEHGLTFKPEIELGSLELIFKFVNIGLGVGCVTKEFIDQWHYSQGIKVLELDDLKLERQIGLIHLNNISLSAASKKFINLLTDDLQD